MFLPLSSCTMHKLELAYSWGSVLSLHREVRLPSSALYCVMLPNIMTICPRIPTRLLPLSVYRLWKAEAQFPMIFWCFAALLTFALQAQAVALNGVFTSVNSIVATGSAVTYPWPQLTSWQATVSWMLDGGAVNAGDTFNLNMPHVFKFTSDTNTISLTANGVTYATWNLFSGGFMVTYSDSHGPKPPD